MKDLIKLTLLNGDFAIFQTIALVLFTMTMLGAILWVYRPGSKSYYKYVSENILDGDKIMSDGKKFDVERPFVVDGIKEYDNPLPSWFIILFLGTILFSVCYLVYYGAMGGALEQEFTTDEKRYEQKQAQLAAQDSSSNLGEEIKDPAMIAAGKEIYTANCAPCHGPQGQGSRSKFNG